MTQQRLLDTNLIIRHLVQDHAAHAKAAAKLFAASDRGTLTLILLPTVLAECVFVLDSFYKHPRPAIAATLTTLLTSPGIHIDSIPIHLDALTRYRQSKLHYVDCTLAATAAAQKIPLATFDTGFKKFPDVTIALD